MPGGNSAKNVHSDSGDLDIDTLTETEMDKLQKQYRMMENNRHMCSIQSQKLILKQRLEIQKLQEEHEELQRNLRASESQSRKRTDSRDAQQIRAHLKRCNELDEQLARERLRQAELEGEIQKMQKKLEEMRKGDVRTSHIQMSQARHQQHTTRALENKLDRALVCFSEQLVKKRKLREELEALHVEHIRFQELHRKLNKKLQEVRREISDVISMSTAAYDARVEAQTKMMMTKENAVREEVQYSNEMKDLERRISHEKRLQDFMTTKCNERAGLNNSVRHRLAMKEEQRTDSKMEAEILEDVFQQLKDVTGEDDLEMLITKFKQNEDRNFALFNYVNEQNTEVEIMKRQIKQMKEEMEKVQVENLQQELHTSLKQMEEQKSDAEAQALEYEAQAKEITEILDQLRTGVSSMFQKLGCDPAAVNDLLGSSAGITDSNIMMYLMLVEEKINELLTMQAYINYKDPEKDYDPKLMSQVLLGQSAEMHKQTPVLQLPVSEHEYNIEEEDRPLTQEELRQRIRAKIHHKEEMQKKCMLGRPKRSGLLNSALCPATDSNQPAEDTAVSQPGLNYC